MNGRLSRHPVNLRKTRYSRSGARPDLGHYSRETLVLYRERPGGQTCVAGENPLAGALSIQPFEVSLFGPRLLWSLNPTELNA